MNELTNILLSYALSHASQTHQSRDLGLAISQPWTEDLSLRAEIGYAQNAVDGNWYSYQRDGRAYRERFDLSYPTYSLALGGELHLSENWRAVSSLRYSSSHGNIDQLTEGQTTKSSDFDLQALRIEVCLRYQFTIATNFLFAVDLISIPNDLWHDTKIQREEEFAAINYPARTEINNAVHAQEDFKLLRIGVGFAF